MACNLKDFSWRNDPLLQPYDIKTCTYQNGIIQSVGVLINFFLFLNNKLACCLSL